MKRNVTTLELKNNKYAFVTLDVAGARRISPGQYAAVSAGDASQYCALRGSYGQGLLIKSSSRLFSSIAERMSKGEFSVEVTDPVGGFKANDVSGRHVVAFAGGSGISALYDLTLNIGFNESVKSVRLFYSESDGVYAYTQGELAGLGLAEVYTMASEGVFRGNPDKPIIGLVSKLTNTAPITFPERPIVFVAGSKGYVDRLRDELVPNFVHEEDFRVNI